MKAYTDKTAQISPKASIGIKTTIWSYTKIRENVRIGEECSIGIRVYIDIGVSIGNRCKIQNGVSIFQGVIIEDEVFIGPHVCFANDKIPRATTLKGKPKTECDWKMLPTVIKKGASIGANVTILPNITIGEYAMIGAGSVITHSVPPFALVYGNPAKIRGQVDKSGKVVRRVLSHESNHKK
ncbi:N-acetyltransferase [Candidatus Roizmanbacteria bacterium]|nr:N-acetyltransferase [Candidatus Roizmanbacteria bacterium]